MRESQDPSADPSVDLAAGEATPFETRLLTAARTDQIPPALELRMARALEMPATAAGASGLSKALLSSKAWLGLSALMLVAMGGGWAWRRAHVISTPHGNQLEAARAVTPSPSTAPRGEAPAMPSAASIAVPPAPPLHAATPVHRHESGGDLREEIALLDTAREAMKNGAFVQALGALDRYAGRFSRGAFAPEAEAMRIEALVRDGQSERARTLGRRFLTQHPSSPLAERVERTLAAQTVN
jgi:TolA-binding protein